MFTSIEIDLIRWIVLGFVVLVICKAAVAVPAIDQSFNSLTEILQSSSGVDVSDWTKS